MLSSLLFFSLILINGEAHLPKLKANIFSLTSSGIGYQWGSFKLQFKRSFQNKSAEAKKLEIFESNLRKINDHNQKYNNGTASYMQGVTPFTDMSSEEFMLFVKKGLNNTSMQFLSNATQHRSNRGIIPNSVDWRTKGYVNPIKDQGSKCGSCWAFSAVSSLEGQYFKINNKLLSFSEQNLVDCTYTSTDGCNGGWIPDAFDTILYKGGIQTSSTYQYNSAAKTSGSCKFNPALSSAKINGFIKVTYIIANEAALTEAIANVGPISVALYISPNFQNYKSGIFVDSTCKADQFNHAATLVGYGSLNGQDYYILRNQWGVSWGEQGYMLFPRNKNNLCGISTYSFYPNVVKESMITNILFPFGSDSNDIALPRTDDGSYGPISLGVKLTFFNAKFSSIHINSNGFISFVSRLNAYNPIVFPTSTPLIALFWGDINTVTNGQIYYRESSSESDLKRAKDEIMNTFSIAFKPTRAYIITFDQVAAYGGTFLETNSFQLVIATDGKITYLIYIYGKMMWPNSGFTKKVQVGYDAGDNVNYFTFPDSFTNNIMSVSTKSNINSPGKWLFKASSSF